MVERTCARDEIRVSISHIHYAMAAVEALDQAGWTPEDPVARKRTATMDGTVRAVKPPMATGST